MKAEQISGLKVVEIEHGTTVGDISGMLIDLNEKRLIGLAVTKGGMFAHKYYIPFGIIISIQNDIVTIPSEASLVQRRNLPGSGVTDTLTGHKVVTEDGKELGEVRSYNIDSKTGDIRNITFIVDRKVLGGLWHTTREHHDVPSEHIKTLTLDDNIVVDNSVPELVGMRPAA